MSRRGYMVSNDDRSTGLNLDMSSFLGASDHRHTLLHVAHSARTKRQRFSVEKPIHSRVDKSSMIRSVLEYRSGSSLSRFTIRSYKDLRTGSESVPASARYFCMSTKTREPLSIKAGAFKFWRVDKFRCATFAQRNKY
jgi:hypothetical protein